MTEWKDYMERIVEMGYTNEFAQDLVGDFIEKAKLNMPAAWGEGEWRKYLDAVLFASQAHAGDMRKMTEIPYIVHPVEASLIAMEMTDDINVVIGAVLHDVVEDTDYGINDICERFGDEIAILVGNETEDKRPEVDKRASWRIRKEEFLEHLQNESKESAVITMSDKLSNMRALCRDYEKIGDKLWQRFNQTDVKQQEWYYRSIAEKTKRYLSDMDSWKEYVELCDKIFGNQ